MTTDKDILREKLNDHYWKMEMDADQFAKNMVAKIVIKLEIPIDIAKNLFSLSLFIEKYPLESLEGFNTLSLLNLRLLTLPKLDT